MSNYTSVRCDTEYSSFKGISLITKEPCIISVIVKFSCFILVGLCMIPKNPVHGVIIQDRFDSGGIIEFACYSGFQLIGSSVLRCVGGQWNSTKPQCRISKCLFCSFIQQKGKISEPFYRLNKERKNTSITLISLPF